MHQTLSNLALPPRYEYSTRKNNGTPQPSKKVWQFIKKQKPIESKTDTAVDSKIVEDDRWEPASIDDLHSGEFELES